MRGVASPRRCTGGTDDGSGPQSELQGGVSQGEEGRRNDPGRCKDSPPAAAYHRTRWRAHQRTIEQPSSRRDPTAQEEENHAGLRLSRSSGKGGRGHEYTSGPKHLTRFPLPKWSGADEDTGTQQTLAKLSRCWFGSRAFYIFWPALRLAWSWYDFQSLRNRARVTNAKNSRADRTSSFFISNNAAGHTLCGNLSCFTSCASSR